MKKEEIMKNFKKGKKNVATNIANGYNIPLEMKDGNSWKLMNSSLSIEDIQELEKEFNIILPEEYREYIMTAAHMFQELVGNLDNFLFEDDVDVILKIEPQPYKEELKYIKENFKNNHLLLQAGYIPLGEFIEDGHLCVDLKNDNEIVWVPFENCVGFTKREEFEQEQLHVFYNFSDYITCFFGGKTHEVEDDE